MTITAASETITDADRAAAGRKALAECPDTFENLRGDGDRDLVEHAAADDRNVLAALDAIGELTADEAPMLGQYLAEQLVEDAIEAEAAKQLGAYRAARLNETPAADQELAYDESDPKHPGFLDRVGV